MKNILDFLKADIFWAYGPSIAVFFNAVVAANGDLVKIDVAKMQLAGNLAAATPNAQGEFITGIAQALGALVPPGGGAPPPAPKL